VIPGDRRFYVGTRASEEALTDVREQLGSTIRYRCNSCVVWSRRAAISAIPTAPSDRSWKT
jgi:hypothetical protein